MIQVAGIDIDGLVIVTGSGGTVRGQVASDDGTPVPGVDRLSVRARPLTWAARSSTLGFSGNGRVNADGTFELKAVVGPVVLSIGTLTGDWTLKSVELNGRNLADDPIDVRHGETLNGVRVVLTNRPTHLRGGLLDEKKQPADGTVVVFPEETSRWREDSRTVRAARPDQRGEFSIKGLPAGKYLIAAVDYVQDGQWYDPEFLADLRPRAQRLSLAEAESKRIDLTVRNSPAPFRGRSSNRTHRSGQLRALFASLSRCAHDRQQSARNHRQGRRLRDRCRVGEGVAYPVDVRVDRCGAVGLEKQRRKPAPLDWDTRCGKRRDEIALKGERDCYRRWQTVRARYRRRPENLEGEDFGIVDTVSDAVRDAVQGNRAEKRVPTLERSNADGRDARSARDAVHKGIDAPFERRDLADERESPRPYDGDRRSGLRGQGSDERSPGDSDRLS